MKKRIGDSGSGIGDPSQELASGYSPPNLDRRTAFKWVLAVAATLRMPEGFGAEIEQVIAAKGYGNDAQRKAVAALADAILPQEGEWPAASTLGVVDFVDEWISAPYPQMQEDRTLMLQGFEWLGAESKRRFRKELHALDGRQLDTLCAELAPGPEQKKDSPALPFFARFRQLVAGAYYTTPQGMRDIGYVGNVPLASYDGPPEEILKMVGVMK
jgi:hypothetical protein